MLREFDSFAEEQCVNQEVMLYIGEAFAFALDLISDVEHKKSLKFASSTKKIKRQLTKDEISKMIVSLPPVCETLYLHACEVECLEKKVIISGYISGKFSLDFLGGVFCVNYYDKDFNYLRGWYRT